MNNEILAALTVLLGSGGLVWKLLDRRDKAKDPLPKASAEVMLAKETLGAMVLLRDAALDDIKRIREERDEDRADIEVLKTHRDEDRKRLANLERLLGVAAGYIEALLRWARGGSKPPHPDLPATLHELIDPELYTLDATDPPDPTGDQ